MSRAKRCYGEGVMDNATLLKQELDTNGYGWLRGVVPTGDLTRLREECLRTVKPGERLNATPILRELLGQQSAMSVLINKVMPSARPVRLVSFAKSGQQNWALPWHQDRVVALKDRVEHPGFSNWTRKSGVWHAEPPIEFLENMIFARIHFTRSDEENGCLELVPKSHTLGFVPADKADDVADRLGTVNCVAAPGDVLLVHALTLHRSRASASGMAREALRVDYANQILPPPLEWALNLDGAR